MQSRIKSRKAEIVPKRCFRIGPPRDSDNVLQLFSLVLERADKGLRSGNCFEIPFAALLRLGNRNQPTLEELNDFCHSGNSGNDWPFALQRNQVRRGRAGSKTVGLNNAGPPDGNNNDNRGPGMFLDLLQFAVESARRFDIGSGAQVCRVLAAVGQTLQAQDKQFREWNTALAARHRNASLTRVAPESRPQAEPEVLVKKAPPWYVEFRRKEEEGACLRLDGLVLWHASYIGPLSAGKSENQDATFAITAPEMFSSSYLIFALADGVTISMGSRWAARSIVRRFCENVLEHMKRDAMVSVGDLIDAAKKTQASLEELTRTLLSEANSYAFDAVRGSDFQRSVATRILENTLNPKVGTMPAALTATLIGGVIQRGNEIGTYQIDALRIGDGNVEHIDRGGHLTSVLDTDREVLDLPVGLGPGPRSRAMFEQPNHLVTKTVILRPGESLIVSSDGLARGHQQPVTSKLAELLGEEFWKTARLEEADGALQVLHKACHFADEIFKRDAKQSLFSDNVSLIVIRAGD